MMRAMVMVMLFTASIARPGPVPLIHAHAHNDYEHARPLVEALECGFCSIEADIHLVDGKLLVAHDLDRVRPDRTLESLYLDPLQQRVRSNGGRVYRDGPAITLLVDIKSNPEPTYAALERVLEHYRGMLSKYDHGTRTAGAVDVIVTGNVPRATIAQQTVRWVACDGTIADLDAEPSPAADLVPQVNGRWTKLFRWRGRGAISEADRTRLGQLVAKTHAQKRRIRFWDAPDNPAAWKVLRDADVDLINTDHLRACRDFLLHERATGAATTQPTQAH
jgi:hypothetical protein